MFMMRRTQSLSTQPTPTQNTRSLEGRPNQVKEEASDGAAVDDANVDMEVVAALALCSDSKSPMKQDSTRPK